MINVGGNFVNLGREGMKAKLRLEKFVFMKLCKCKFKYMLFKKRL
jgi:hypothetical protein